MIPALAIGITVALSVIVMFVGVLRLVESQMSPEERLDIELARRLAPERLEEPEEHRPLIVQWLDQLFSGRGFSERISQELVQANLNITVSEYILIRIAVILGAFLAGMLWRQDLGTAAILAVIGFIVPPFYIRRRRQKRLEAFNNQLEDVLTLIIGALRAGYSFLHALNVVIDEIPPPASEEFRRVVREVGLGLSLQEALQNLVQRVESEDLDMIVTAITIQQDVGGNLATILDLISETIRERIRIQNEIRTITTQQRVTGYILAFLPFILGGIIYLLNPRYMKGLFAPGFVRILPVVATVLVAIGFVLIRRIVDIEV